MRLVALLAMVTMVGCVLPYGGKCEEIKPGTALSTLPVTQTSAAQTAGVAGSVVAGSKCSCANDAGCDCVYAKLGAPYVGSGCSAEGQVLECSVWAQDGGVVGVFAHCESRR